MAGRLMRFCFCAECEAVVEESVNMVRWFEYDFCAITCLSKFVRKNVGDCSECHTKITPQPIHAIKAVPRALASIPLTSNDTGSSSNQPNTIFVSSASQFISTYFCSALCSNAYKEKSDLCEFCFKPSTGNVDQDNDVAQRKSTFCSPACRKLMQICASFHQLFVAKCVQCDEKGKITQRCLLDDTEYLLCSPACRFRFEMDKDVNLEICNQCSRHFVNKNNAAFLLMDIDCDVVFCGIKCMVHYLMTVEKTSACVQCSTIGNHFTMIRSARNITRRSWCSMKCALNDKSFLITEEAVIDLTLEREEFFDAGQASHNDKTQLIKDMLNTSEIPIAGNTSASYKPSTSNEVISNTRLTIPPLTEAESIKLLKERQKSYTRSCEACNKTVTNSKTFLRWFSMEFCDLTCFTTFVDSNVGCVCWSCDSIIGITDLCVHSERIENVLRLFCSHQCKTDYLAANQMCGYCNKLLATPNTCADGVKRFCSIDCDRKFRRLIDQEVIPVLKPCTDCRQTKQVKINFLYNGVQHPFCSWACFFFLKFTCGIHADQCMMCHNHFVRRLADAHTIRYDNMANIFCSTICASHFLVKYRSIAVCAFCSHPSYDLYMVTMITNRGTSEQYYCSKSCLELAEETENAVLVDIGPEAEQEIREFMALQRQDKNQFVQLPGKRVSVATQTDFADPDNNNNNDTNNNHNGQSNKYIDNIHHDKENKPRVILAARKRTANGKVLKDSTIANAAGVEQAIVYEID